MKNLFNKNAALRGAWRRIFARSPLAIEVLKEGKRTVPKYNKDGSRALRDAVEFHCQVCSSWVKASVNGKKNISVDHVIPVMDITADGDTENFDWNRFEKALFCEKQNLQRICRTCHNVKTQEERRARQTFRDLSFLNSFNERTKTLTLQEKQKLLKKYTTKTKNPAVIIKAKGLLEIL